MTVPTISIESLPARSIFDIISFAFHRAGRQWRLLVFLAIPVLVICGFLEALTTDVGLDLPLLNKEHTDMSDMMNPNTARYYAHTIFSVIALVGGGWYLNYLYLRAAVTDLTGGMMNRSFRQFVPDNAFWGYIGITMILGLLLLLVGGISILGIFLVIGLIALMIKAPVLILLVVLASIVFYVALTAGFLMVWIRLFLTLPFYFLAPAEGMLHALRSAWQHSKDNWWRTLGFSMFLTILLQMMLLPLIMTHSIVAMITGNDIPGFKIIEPGIMRTVILITEQMLWLSGTLLITQSALAYGKVRLALDLITRRLQRMSPQAVGQRA